MKIGDNICELKNIATKEGEERKGYAKRLIKYLYYTCGKKYGTMKVGTTQNNIPFYVKCGFTDYWSTVENYFINNYKEEIWDGALQCKNMYYYAMTLPTEFRILEVTTSNREAANDILKNEWGSTNIISRGEIIDGTKLSGFIASNNKGEIIGLITYFIYPNNVCEIYSLNNYEKNIGIGTKLIEEVKKVAIKNKCKLIKLITTNDNVEALKFYQKRGFKIFNIYINSIEISRKLKPEIPLYADNGIKITDEIELRMEILND
ncbi:MAG: GNAT family N-acetyltransferase [Clostridia bacterium]|nr:GNAT family N-acetyltransferase [Clostridia bacterium]